VPATLPSPAGGRRDGRGCGNLRGTARVTNGLANAVGCGAWRCRPGRQHLRVYHHTHGFGHAAGAPRTTFYICLLNAACSNAPAACTTLATPHLPRVDAAVVTTFAFLRGYVPRMGISHTRHAPSASFPSFVCCSRYCLPLPPACRCEHLRVSARLSRLFSFIYARALDLETAMQVFVNDNGYDGSGCWVWFMSVSCFLQHQDEWISSSLHFMRLNIKRTFSAPSYLRNHAFFWCLLPPFPNIWRH